MTLGRVEMELLDGRVINLTGLTVDAAIARIREEGITPSMVKQTTHFIRRTQERS